MSDRERWIVYPLLLLALGTSMRIKMFGTEQLQVHRILDAEQISCRRMILTNDDGEPLLAIAPNTDGKFGIIEAKRGALNINGPVLAKAMRCEELAVVDRKGQRVVTLDAQYVKKPDGDAELRGGRMILFNGNNKPRIVIGESPVGGTVTAFDDAGKGVIIGHVQPKPGVRLAGLFTVAEDGKTIKPLGTKFDTSVEGEKPEE
ncbi:MAG: hypothetical protein MI757_17250 [Pirellulales bacterium]|nr:hypothetical protein [Pirellulales bacterium]